MCQAMAQGTQGRRGTQGGQGTQGRQGTQGGQGTQGLMILEAIELANKKNLFINIECHRIRCYLTKMVSGI